MKKCFIFVLVLLFLTACDKSKNENDTSQINPTQSVENNTPQISPTPSVENNTPQISPTPSVENNTPQISPTPSVEIDQTINEGITTPVLVKGLFMGGISSGKWMQRDEFFNSGVVNFDGFEYDVYTDDTNMGTAIGRQPINWISGESIQGDQYEKDFSIVELYDKNNQKINYDIAMKADWNLFPRSYTEQNTEQEVYINLVNNYLIEYGLENPETSIKQIVRVDLEGDGTDEMMIAADNTIEDQFEEVKKGDNAVLLFRKVVDGEVIDQIVEQDIRLKDDEYPSIYRVLSRVETIADLDGDSVMEVIVRSWYYEGKGWSIYKIIDNRLVLVASNGYGA